MKSTFLTVDKKDAIKALILAIVVPVLNIVIETLNSGVLSFDWKKIAIVGISAGLAYILKNWLTNSDDKLLVSEK